MKRPGDLTFALLNEFLDDIVTVTERDINEMILLMLEKHKLVVEAAGAVSLAALEHLQLRSRKFAEAQVRMWWCRSCLAVMKTLCPLAL